MCSRNLVKDFCVFPSIRFDILVNGGGAITLQFQRSPFRPTKKTVLVPWNKIVIMEKAVLFTMNEQIDQKDELNIKEPLCAVHDYDKMAPIIYQTWKPGFEGGCPKKTTIYAEHQVNINHLYYFYFPQCTKKKLFYSAFTTFARAVFHILPDVFDAQHTLPLYHKPVH